MLCCVHCIFFHGSIKFSEGSTGDGEVRDVPVHRGVTIVSSWRHDAHLRRPSCVGILPFCVGMRRLFRVGDAKQFAFLRRHASALNRVGVERVGDAKQFSISASARVGIEPRRARTASGYETGSQICVAMCRKWSEAETSASEADTDSVSVSDAMQTRNCVGRHSSSFGYDSQDRAPGPPPQKPGKASLSPQGVPAERNGHGVPGEWHG